MEYREYDLIVKESFGIIYFEEFKWYPIKKDGKVFYRFWVPESAADIHREIEELIKYYGGQLAV
jgi:hypothetical protein